MRGYEFFFSSEDCYEKNEEEIVSGGFRKFCQTVCPIATMVEF